MFKYFPREIANPYRLRVENEKEMLEYINKWNGYYDLYYSLYDLDNFYIDKVVYDLDNENSLNNIRKLHEYFTQQDIKHTMFFSGNGFHFYFFTINYKDLKSPKETLKNVQLYFLKHLKLSYGCNDEDIDSKCIGDIRRIMRFPNTLNKKSNLYIIPIDEEILNKNIFLIKELSILQQFNITYYGKKLVDLSKFDYINKEEIKNDIEIQNNHYIAGDFKNLLPCLQQMLLKPELANNIARYYYTLGCKTLLFKPEDCDKLAREYWSNTKDSTGRKTKYKEFCEEHQIQYVYEKENTYFPKCEVLKQFCDKDCGKRWFR